LDILAVQARVMSINAGPVEQSVETWPAVNHVGVLVIVDEYEIGMGTGEDPVSTFAGEKYVLIRGAMHHVIARPVVELGTARTRPEPIGTQTAGNEVAAARSTEPVWPGSASQLVCT
jgi:hypothetical protein